jgi:hypothetical protein
MLRVLALAAGLALAAVTAAPATAAGVALTCISLDSRCQTFTCPAGTRTVFNNGFTDTGPWVVICSPV